MRRGSSVQVNEAYMAYLRTIVDAGSRPAVWDGMGRDDSVPEKVAKRLEVAGLIRLNRGRWIPTLLGLRACGRDC